MIWTRAQFHEPVWLGRLDSGLIAAAVRPYGSSFRWNLVGGPPFSVVESLDDALAAATEAATSASEPRP